MIKTNSKNLFSLANKIVVITGAAGLLGKQHAIAVASHGGVPVLLDVNLEKLDALVQEIKRDFNIVTKGYCVDITNEEQVRCNAEEVVSDFGKIDALVNNAANNPKIESNDTKNFSRVENFSLDVWQSDIEVGLTGAFLCSKHYGQKLLLNSNGGVIVNIASDLGVIAPDQRLYKDERLPKELQAVKPVTYSVVKSGLIGLTRYLATYWPEYNVRCNALCPGGIENGQSEEFIERVNYRIPLNRMAKKNEYQSSLIWMLSDNTEYLNGAVISVDGGRSSW